MANTYLTKTFSGNGSATTHTLSMWVKRGQLDSIQKPFFTGSGSNQHQLLFMHYPAGGLYNMLEYEFYDGTNNYYIRTNRRFQDTNAWYHIVAVWDTTNATSGDRMRLYVNGIRETSFQREAQPPQNFNGYCNQSTYAHRIGASDTGHYFDGLISHLHSIDGTVYDASAFGSTDSTTGEWKINTSPSITMGTNGFTILKDGNTITDQSSNSNDFTLGGGSLTDTPDCPSNIFANFDNLTPYHGTNFLGHERANTRTGTNSGVSYLNLLPNKGKWFVEYRINTAGAGQDNGVGFWSVMEAQTYAFYQTDFRGIVWKYAGNVYVDGVNNAFSSDTFTSGDIISIAMDFDNDQATFYKNGTVATNLNNYSYNFSNHFVISTGILDGATASAEDGIFDLNAGQNPTFGGRATAGTNADANGHGLFSMAVPTGYYAICTKNIKLYGG